MILSKHEQDFLKMLDDCDGPMPLEWLKQRYRTLVPRLRELGLLYRRDPDWVRLTKLGRRALVGGMPK